VQFLVRFAARPELGPDLLAGGEQEPGGGGDQEAGGHLVLGLSVALAGRAGRVGRVSRAVGLVGGPDAGLAGACGDRGHRLPVDLVVDGEAVGGEVRVVDLAADLADVLLLGRLVTLAHGGAVAQRLVRDDHAIVELATVLGLVGPGDHIGAVGDDLVAADVQLGVVPPVEAVHVAQERPQDRGGQQVSEALGVGQQVGEGRVGHRPTRPVVRAAHALDDLGRQEHALGDLGPLLGAKLQLHPVDGAVHRDELDGLPERSIAPDEGGSGRGIAGVVLGLDDREDLGGERVLHRVAVTRGRADRAGEAQLGGHEQEPGLGEAVHDAGAQGAVQHGEGLELVQHGEGRGVRDLAQLRGRLPDAPEVAGLERPVGGRGVAERVPGVCLAGVAVAAGRAELDDGEHRPEDLAADLTADEPADPSLDDNRPSLVA